MCGLIHYTYVGFDLRVFGGRFVRIVGFGSFQSDQMACEILIYDLVAHLFFDRYIRGPAGILIQFLNRVSRIEIEAQRIFRILAFCKRLAVAGFQELVCGIFDARLQEL